MTIQVVSCLPDGAEYMRRSQICKRIGISLMTFHRMMGAGKIPDPDFVLGTKRRSMFWTRSTIDRWLAEQAEQARGAARATAN